MLNESREGWPLLTVETELNGDSKSTNERGPSLVSSLGLSCRYKRFLFCLGCSSRPSTKYFSSSFVHYFNSFFLIAQQAEQAVVLGRLACLLICTSDCDGKGGGGGLAGSSTHMVGSLKMNTALEYSTRVVQEGDRRCKKSTLNDLAYLTPLRIPLMNPVIFSCLLVYGQLYI
jgi:hypothetical protein